MSSSHPYITVRYIKASSSSSESFSQDKDQHVIEAQFPLIEIKPHKIPSSFKSNKKVRTEPIPSVEEATTSNNVHSYEDLIAHGNTTPSKEQQQEQKNSLTSRKYKVDIKAIADYFNLEDADCILQKDCGRMCMLMDHTVVPYASYIVSGTMRSTTVADELQSSGQ
ncbi:hypothetical protein C9374_002240 [Naegleria lovaniensis]|uniref:Uncharacterized protein n=1 Tax=Naegleria lovaniensis TaxID=51637 RepID=A0AA88GVA0_NAELO|nr:uncharacterized protein C9374_002240 [Naegleria lovaniensis]KAG2386496.1 hypothetical protein C9374_002240 [Naegleria lovaniensis]